MGNELGMTTPEQRKEIMKKRVKKLAVEAAQYIDNLSRLYPCLDCRIPDQESCTYEPGEVEDSICFQLGSMCYGRPQHPNVPQRYISTFGVENIDDVEVRSFDGSVILSTTMLIYGARVIKCPETGEKRAQTIHELYKEMKEQAEETGEVFVYRGKDGYFDWTDKAPELVIELANKIRILDMDLAEIINNKDICRKNDSVHGLYASDLRSYGKDLCNSLYHPTVEYDEDNNETSFYEITFMGDNIYDFDSVEEIIERHASIDMDKSRLFLFNMSLDKVIHFNEINYD